MPSSDPTDLKSLFAHLTDPRVDRRKRHVLLDIVAISIFAVVCGADSWVAVATFGRAKEAWLRGFLALPNGIPSHDTFGRVFALLDPEAFAQGFSRWVATLRTMLPHEIIAIDGKTLRGSFDSASDTDAIHMVSAWACNNGLLLGQRKVDSKSNEITAIPKVLDMLDLQGATITIDAMGCQRAIAEQIIQKGGNYSLALKGNQKDIHYEVTMNVGSTSEEILTAKGVSSSKSVDGDHGRIEERQHWVMSDLHSMPMLKTWPGIKALGIVDRTRVIKGRMTKVRAFYLLSDIMSAEQFAWTIRAHWGIENALHWSLDVSFNEDKSRVRKDNAAENFGTLRRMALTLLKQADAKVGIATKRLLAGWDNDFLLRVVAGSLL